MGGVIARYCRCALSSRRPSAMPKKPIKKPAARKTAPTTIYQFKITLLETRPKIWRRIQISDCKLNTLHYHIQAAMGWTNSHLHHFIIGRKRYGIPKRLDDPC